MEIAKERLLEKMHQLEEGLCAKCPQLTTNGMVELPLVALSGGPRSALVAAALNRHLPLNSFSLIPQGEEQTANLEKIVEFLGTTHHVVAISDTDSTNLKDQLAAAARTLGYDSFFTGSDLQVCIPDLTAAELAALFSEFVPCLK